MVKHKTWTSLYKALCVFESMIYFIQILKLTLKWDYTSYKNSQFIVFLRWRGSWITTRKSEVLRFAGSAKNSHIWLQCHSEGASETRACPLWKRFHISHAESTKGFFFPLVLSISETRYYCPFCSGDYSWHVACETAVA